MKFLNKKEVTNKLRYNLSIKSAFSNSLYTKRSKGKFIDVLQKLDQWILNNGDALFQHEL